jgi:hypothetical protein
MSKRKGTLEKTMKNLRSLLVLTLTTACFLLAGTAAKADSLTITLTAPLQSGVQGDVIAFDATVTNNSDLTAYLNFDNPYVDSPLTIDDSPFFDTDVWPLTLAGDSSASGLLFNIDIPEGTAAGLYTGFFQIQGGYDNSGEQDTLGTANFDVQVTPEPSSLLLLGSGLLALGVFSGRKFLA